MCLDWRWAMPLAASDVLPPAAATAETHVPWAITFHDPLANQIVANVPLHPTQLYEMLVELANCLFRYGLSVATRFEGEIIGAYMIIYGIARYFIEFFRGGPGSWRVPRVHVRNPGHCHPAGHRRGLLWMRRVPLRQPAKLASVRERERELAISGAIKAWPCQCCWLVPSISRPGLHASYLTLTILRPRGRISHFGRPSSTRLDWRWRRNTPPLPGSCARELKLAPPPCANRLLT